MGQEKISGNNSAIVFLKKFVGFSLATGISAVITFVATFINTRIFAPATLGQINLFITVQNFLLYIACLGLDQAYCRYYYEYKKADEKKTLFQICLRVSLVVVAVLGAVVLFAWKPVSGYIGGESSFVVAVALVIATLEHTIGRYFSLAQKKKKKMSI